jgi:D-lactate dehydrogenase
MRITFFDIHSFEKKEFEWVNQRFGFDLNFLDIKLNSHSAPLASGSEVVCSFAHDTVDRKALEELRNLKVQLVALRSAGFNHVDLKAAQECNIPVVRVPKYSPYSVAEHATALLLALNRKIPRAYNRVRELNFSLDSLVGFDLHEKTVGILGTGNIGSAFARIMNGFGCKILAYDLKENLELKSQIEIKYTSLENIYQECDVISLHLPLTPETKHLIDDKSFKQMKPGVFLINTSRGGLVDTASLIRALKSGHLGAAGLDVYEEEENIFFKDLSNTILQDDQLARLITFSNVLITAHQGFLTQEALRNIAETTMQNISDFQNKKPLVNEVRWQVHQK